MKSITGATLSILLILVLLMYTGLKVDNLLRRSQVDIISAINEDFYEETHQVGAKQGFNFAVALGETGGEIEDFADLDPRIGSFVFTAVQFDITKDDPEEIYKVEFLDHHECSDEELGKIHTENIKLMPMKEN